MARYHQGLCSSLLPKLPWKGKALSCEYLSLDPQTLWGLRNKWNLTNVLMSLHVFSFQCLLN